MKKIKRYNKLIRDKILEIVEKDGEKIFWRVLRKNEFLKGLKKKILEEAKELLKAKTKREIINEVVDIQELIDVLTSEMKLK
ncbi:MAG: hypothetical protein ACP5H7_02860, partial [Minisyncoccia bacterium]